MKIAWNTGRLYSDYGQIIIARLLPEEDSVHFIDITRGIDGKFPIKCRSWYEGNEDALRNVILNKYDVGDFEPLTYEEEQSLKPKKTKFNVISYSHEKEEGNDTIEAPAIEMAHKVLCGMDGKNLRYHVVFKDSSDVDRVAYCRMTRFIEVGRERFLKELIDFLSM